MSKIGLTSGFQIVPEGKHVFKITKVTYDEQFGQMTIRMTTANGISHEERFRLLTNDSEPNERALNAFSYFAKTATQNYENREIDTDELVGCFIGATVTHTSQPNRKDPTRTVTFANLSDYFEAGGFEDDAPADDGKRGSILASLGL